MVVGSSFQRSGLYFIPGAFAILVVLPEQVSKLASACRKVLHWRVGIIGVDGVLPVVKLYTARSSTVFGLSCSYLAVHNVGSVLVCTSKELQASPAIHDPIICVQSCFCFYKTFTFYRSIHRHFQFH